MTIENVREILVELLSDNQSRFSLQDDGKDELLYTLAFNDGLTAMAEKIIERIRKEEEE